ncbi:MAG: hypothetical protein KKG95_04930, partial [Candidatus Omnitrophica bacterium]|nr:hypothetical protein [Candidatus Omnitrophota bacterium]
GTMFSEKHLALFVVMKHSTSGADMRLKIDTLHKKDRGRMDFKKALKGVAGWVAASGTVKKTGAVIKELGAERIMLKMEPSLKVHKGVIDIGVMGNGRQVVDIMTGKLKRGTTRLCIYTEKDGGNVRKAYSEFKENGLKGVKIELVLGRDMGVFKKEIARISREIQQDPTLKRAVFVQGLGDGSNIAKMPDWFTCRLKGWKGSNRPRACLIKGDLAPSDFVAQVAQRLNLEKANMGGKGRMKGSFIQLISLNDPWLTGQQRAELKNAKNQDAKKQSKIILRIQEEMLTDINARNVCQIYEAKGEHTAAEVSRVVQYFRERAAWSANRQNDSGSYDIASAAKTLDISGENGMDMDYMENFMAERGWVNPAGYLTQEAQVFVSQAAVLLNTDDNGKGELKLMGIDLGTNNTLENVFKVMDTMTTNGVIDFSNTGERGVGRLISLGSVINGLNNMMTETNKITLDMNDLTKIFTSFNETEKLGVILSKLEGSGSAVSRFREPLKASFELKEKARDGMIKFEALATEKAELEHRYNPGLRQKIDLAYRSILARRDIAKTGHELDKFNNRYTIDRLEDIAGMGNDSKLKENSAAALVDLLYLPGMTTGQFGKLKAYNRVITENTPGRVSVQEVIGVMNSHGENALAVAEHIEQRISERGGILNPVVRGLSRLGFAEDYGDVLKATGELGTEKGKFDIEKMINSLRREDAKMSVGDTSLSQTNNAVSQIATETGLDVARIHAILNPEITMETGQEIQTEQTAAEASMSRMSLGVKPKHKPSGTRAEPGYMDKMDEYVQVRVNFVSAKEEYKVEITNNADEKIATVHLDPRIGKYFAKLETQLDGKFMTSILKEACLARSVGLAELDGTVIISLRRSGEIASRRSGEKADWRGCDGRENGVIALNM